MSSFEWAVPAVDLLYENGVVHGTGNGTYSPGQQITRGDYVLMLCQAFQLSGQGRLDSGMFPGTATMPRLL